METDLVSSALTIAIDSPPASISVNRPLRTIFCLVLTDSLALTLSLLAGSLTRNYSMHHPLAPTPGTAFAALLLSLCSLTAAGLYPGVNVNPVDELRRSTYAITLAFLALLSGTFLLHDLSQSRLVYGLAYLLAVILVPLFRSLARSTFARKSWWGSSIAILGFGATGKFVYDTLLKNPGLGLKPIAVLDDNPDKYAGMDEKVKTGPLVRCLEIARDHKISYGIVCMPAIGKEQLLHFLDLYGQCFSHLMVIPNLIGMTSLGICAREVGGVIGLEVTRQLLRPSTRFVKRALDIAFVLVLSPLTILLTAICAALIKIEDRGPVFYRDERIGLRGRKFKAWKLRSMVVNGDEALATYLNENPAEAIQWANHQKLKRDPRLTAVGAIIRKTSIDEIPQFWNVLLGEMSVVGPRPILEKQIEQYGPGFDLYKRVRPGITGLWQVSGRNHLSFAERAKLDKYVIQNWSVWLDLYILARTATAVLTGHGAF